MVVIVGGSCSGDDGKYHSSTILSSNLVVHHLHQIRNFRIQIGTMIVARVDNITINK